MYDPRRGEPRPEYIHPAAGIAGAFIPLGAVGVLAGLFIAILYAVLSGLVTGIWLILAGVALIALVPLTARALRNEIRRENRRGSRSAPYVPSLPADSELSEDERREAMRRYGGGK